MTTYLENQNLSAIKNYISKFKLPERFIFKIINSLNTPFRIINAETKEVLISNNKEENLPIEEYEKIITELNETQKPIQKKITLNEKEIEIYCHPIFAPNGKIVSLIETRQSLNEQKKLEKEIEKIKTEITKNKEKTDEIKKDFEKKIEQKLELIKKYQKEIRTFKKEKDKFTDKRIELEKDKLELEKELKDQKQRKLILKEASKIALTDNERKVMWGIVKDPSTKDETLSKELGIKRTTVTAIKNRLKEKKWINYINIPNFSYFDCKIFSIILNEFKTNLTQRKSTIENLNNSPEIILDTQTENSSVNIFISQKQIALEKYLEKLKTQNHLKKETKELTFTRENDEIELFNFSKLIEKTFGLKETENESFQISKNSKQKLNINDKKVLLTLLEEPDLSMAGIAKKILLSKPTVSKIKKKLLDNNLIYTLVVPNLIKLDYELAAVIAYEFKKNKKEIENFFKDQNQLLKISGNNKVTRIIFFKNIKEYEEELRKFQRFAKKENISAEIETSTFQIDEEPFVNKLNCSKLIKNILFSD